MTSGARDNFTLLLRRYIQPLLVKRGFTRRGCSFHASRNSIEWFVGLQRSRWDDRDELEFTVNVGVYVPGVMSVFRNRKEPDTIKIEDCTVSCRIGLLTDDKQDRWWKLASQDDRETLQVTASEITAILESKAMPFLERFPTQEAVATFLTHERNPFDQQIYPQSLAYALIYAAIILKQIGIDKRSRECVNRALTVAKGSPSEESVKSVAERL